MCNLFERRFLLLRFLLPLLMQSAVPPSTSVCLRLVRRCWYHPSIIFNCGVFLLACWAYLEMQLHSHSPLNKIRIAEKKKISIWKDQCKRNCGFQRDFNITWWNKYIFVVIKAKWDVLFLSNRAKPKSFSKTSAVHKCNTNTTLFTKTTNPYSSSAILHQLRPTETFVRTKSYKLSRNGRTLTFSWVRLHLFHISIPEPEQNEEPNTNY